MHAHAHLGDDAEHTFGAHDQLTQIRPGGRGGGAAEGENARRGDDPKPAHHVIEAAVARRILTRRAGGREAADGGELEALREVPDRKALRSKQFLGIGTGDASTELGYARDLVEVV